MRGKALIPALVAWIAACAHSPAVGNDAIEAAPAQSNAETVEGSDAALEVENNSTSDVRIFVLRGSMPTRIGLVSGMSTATFQLGAQLIDREIRLYASPVGGTQRARTDAFRVRAGQLVSWKLDNRLRSDRLSVY
jgi:hypothetical protein